MYLWRDRGRSLLTLGMQVAVLAALAAVAKGEPQSACDALHQKYADGGVERDVSVWGREHELHVYTDARAPSRAAAALLAAGLRHRLRYRVVLHREPASSLCRLATRLRTPPPALDGDTHKADLVLIPSSVWGASEDRCEALQQSDGAGEAPPRLRVLGAGAAPARLRLHAHLARRASELPLCRRATCWSFYRDDKTLETCSFLLSDPTTSKNASKDVKMYYNAERRDSAVRLAAIAARFGLRLRPVPLGLDSAPRRKLLTLLHEGNYSFLFLDYEIWSSKDRVLILDPPPDENDPDAVNTVRLADTWKLRKVAPVILQAFYRFEPTLKDLREVLEIEAQREDSNLTEAACTVASSNSKFKSWFNLTTDNFYEVAVFLCQDDPDYTEHFTVLSKIAPIIIKHLVKPSFKIRIKSFPVSCGDEHSLMTHFMTRARSVHWARVAGTLAGGAGARAAAAAAGALDAALVLYDVPAPLRPGHATRVATGRRDHLVRALQHFVSKFEWTRLAVLSEDSKLACALVKSLQATNAFVVLNVEINPSPTAALKTLLQSKARIIFVNSNSSLALSVLCAARDLDMTPEAGYVWILREWYVTDNITCQREPLSWNHFTISFWWRGGNVSYQFNSSIVKNTLDAKFGDSWPLRAAPLSDALHLLLRGFQNFLQNNPHRQYDIKGGNATRLFWENLENQPIEGVTQTFKLDRYGIKNPLIYIDVWYGNRRDPLAVWQVDNGEIRELYTQRPIFPNQIPSDGAEFCLFKSNRHAFSPSCYDGYGFTALAAAALALPSLVLARRVRRRRLEQRRLAFTARLLQLSGSLAGLLVDRAALDLRGEIGAGRFGIVRSAVLRTSRRSIDVAAKALRDESTPAEEREFLNEAVILSSLRHERVVRLVGVCVGGGPPLVLMERAFFRDLLGYLRKRRELAAGAAEAAGAAAGAGEAAHVGAAALTRLARQAAAALEYLRAQGVVHRDVRAANCLVDVRRELKLADFGLARRTVGGEYSCRRRGLLPVPWMAPESLARGVFSAASDAWGLGVLLLELLTLGARPYGAWPAQRVLRHVSAGGRPPLPRDVTPGTRRVLAGCWRRDAHERTTAAALGAFLDANPELLSPALGPIFDNDQDDSPGVVLLER